MVTVLALNVGLLIPVFIVACLACLIYGLVKKDRRMVKASLITLIIIILAVVVLELFFFE